MFKKLYKDKTNPTTKVAVVQATAPVVLITGEAMRKMQLLVESISDEVGWFMTVTKEADANIYSIHNVYLFEQRVHGTTTEVDEQLLSDFAQELVQIPDFELIWNNIKGWGHSHVNMGVTPSGQDDSQMEFFSRTGFEFFIRVIANKKGEMKIDVYNYTLGIAYHDVKYFILPSDEERETKTLLDKLEAEYKEMKEMYEASLKEVEEKLFTDLEANFGGEIKSKVKKFETRRIGHVGFGTSETLSHGGQSWNREFYNYEIDGMDVDDDDYEYAVIGGRHIKVESSKKKETLKSPKTTKAKGSTKKEALRTIDIYEHLNEGELIKIAENLNYSTSVEYIDIMYPEFKDMFKPGYHSVLWNESQHVYNERFFGGD